jgi:hypothetical protein
VKSDIEILLGLRDKEDGVGTADATGVDTLLESVAEGLLARDWVGAEVSTASSHKMLGVIPCWDELLAVDAKFHKITYRYKIRETTLDHR